MKDSLAIIIIRFVLSIIHLFLWGILTMVGLIASLLTLLAMTETWWAIVFFVIVIYCWSMLNASLNAYFADDIRW